MSKEDELSFSSSARASAEKRFPGGTLDWFLTSDFSIDCTSISLLDQIAKGSYGTVYKGVMNGMLVAAKIEDFHEEDEEQVNLLVELSMLQSFPHERLVRYFGSGCLPNSVTGKKTIMIVLELCKYGAMRECLQHDLPWNLRTRLALDTIVAIGFLHENGIIHRDIKTTNILIDETWRAKLCDFSFACHDSSSDASKQSFVFGTDEFMSPEVALALTFGTATDIFSFGILLCELLTGREPCIDFLYRRPQEMFALNEKEFRDSILPGCPEELEALTLLCCDVTPENRPTAQTCIEELQKILDSLGGTDFPFSLEDISATPRPTSFTTSPIREGHVKYPGKDSLGSSSPRKKGLRDNTDNRLSHLELQLQELKAENTRLSRELHTVAQLDSGTYSTSAFGSANGRNTDNSYFGRRRSFSSSFRGPVSGNAIQEEFEQEASEDLTIHDENTPASAKPTKVSRRISRRMSAPIILPSSVEDAITSIPPTVPNKSGTVSTAVSAEVITELAEIRSRLKVIEQAVGEIIAAESTQSLFHGDAAILAMLDRNNGQIDYSDPSIVRAILRQVKTIKTNAELLESSLEHHLGVGKTPPFLKTEDEEREEEDDENLEIFNSNLVPRNAPISAPTSPKKQESIFLTAVESVDGDASSHASHARYDEGDDDDASNRTFDVDLSAQAFQHRRNQHGNTLAGQTNNFGERHAPMINQSQPPPSMYNAHPDLQAALGSFLDVVQKCSGANEKTKVLISSLDRSFTSTATQSQLFIGDYLKNSITSKKHPVNVDPTAASSSRPKSLRNSVNVPPPPPPHANSNSAQSVASSGADRAENSFLHSPPHTTMLHTGKGQSDFLLSGRKSPAAYSFSSTPTMRGQSGITGANTGRSVSPESAAKTWKMAGATPSPVPYNIQQYREYRNSGKLSSHQSPTRASVIPYSTKRGAAANGSGVKEQQKNPGAYDSTLAKNFFRADPNVADGGTQQRRESPTNRSRPDLLFHQPVHVHESVKPKPTAREEAGTAINTAAAGATGPRTQTLRSTLQQRNNNNSNNIINNFGGNSNGNNSSNNNNRNSGGVENNGIVSLTVNAINARSTNSNNNNNNKFTQNTDLYKRDDSNQPWQHL